MVSDMTWVIGKSCANIGVSKKSDFFFFKDIHNAIKRTFTLLKHGVMDQHLCSGYCVPNEMHQRERTMSLSQDRTMSLFHLVQIIKVTLPPHMGKQMGIYFDPSRNMKVYRTPFAEICSYKGHIYISVLHRCCRITYHRA